MPGMEWIKVVTNMYEDDKIVLIDQEKDADSILTVWVKLLCLAGKCNASGVLVLDGKPYDAPMLAAVFHRQKAKVARALKVLDDLGLIANVDGVIVIPKWEEHQQTEQVEAKRNAVRERVAKHRAKQRGIIDAANVTREVTPGNADVTPENVQCNATDIRIQNKDKKEKENIKKSGERFSPPTPEEVNQYAQESGCRVDGYRFCNFYASKGWMIGRNPMKDWRAAVRTWARKDGANGEAGRDHCGNADGYVGNFA